MRPTVQLRRLTSMTYGDALSAETRIPGAVPVMSSGGVTGLHDVPNTLAPSIVVGRKGSHGSVWWSDAPAFVIDTAYSIDGRNTHQDLRWLYYVLLSADLRSISADVGVPGLSRQAAYETLVPSPPPVAEQRRIADFLDDQVARIDNIIAARQGQAILVDDCLNSQVVADINEVRSHSSVAPLRRLVDAVITGSTPAENLNDESGLAWYSPASIIGDGVLGSPVRRVSSSAGRSSGVVRFPAGSVLLVGIGATAGRVALLLDQASGNQQITAIKPNDLLSVSFLFHQLKTRRGELLTTAPFTTLPILNNEIVRRFDVVAPARPEQDRLVAEWDAEADHVSRTKLCLAQSVDLLKELKRSLITAAVTGEFDVSSADGSRVPA